MNPDTTPTKDMGMQPSSSQTIKVEREAFEEIPGVVAASHPKCACP
jgi:hypothetical protein